MTIHKIKEEFILKASIGELVAALDGMVTAGVTAVKNGGDTKTHPIASLGYHAAALSYDVRTELSIGRMEIEKAAFEITEFLNASTEVLAGYPDIILSLPKGATGGTLRDVISHIDEILTREDIGGERPAVKFLNGNLQNKFVAAYLPKAVKETAEPKFEGDEEPEAAPEKVPAKRGRKKSYAWSAPASVLV